MKKENWKKLKFGDFEHTKENGEVLKKLLTPIIPKFDLQKIIEESRTKIKTPKFENMKGGKK